jgi:hypothetical protein
MSKTKGISWRRLSPVADVELSVTRCIGPLCFDALSTNKTAETPESGPNPAQKGASQNNKN